MLACISWSYDVHVHGWMDELNAEQGVLIDTIIMVLFDCVFTTHAGCQIADFFCLFMIRMEVWKCYKLLAIQSSQTRERRGREWIRPLF